MDGWVREYWIFVEAMLEQAAALFGVDRLNAHAASLGYPFGAALALSVFGFAVALGLLRLGRPGLGLAGLAIAEELSAVSLATAALAPGARLEAAMVIVRIAAIALALVLLSATLRRALKLSRETPRAAPRTPPAW